MVTEQIRPCGEESVLWSREKGSREDSRRWAGWLWQGLRHLVIEGEENAPNLAKADEHLKTGALLVYALHPSKLDAAVVPPYYATRLRNMVRAVVPAGRAQMVGRQKWYLERVVGARLHVHAMPVVRQREADTPYGDERDRLLEELSRETKLGLESGGGFVYGAAPAGTRTQVLSQVNPSFMKLGREYPKTLMVPMGMWRADRRIVSGIRVPRLHIRVGRPFFASELGLDMDNLDGLVRAAIGRLAALLPVEIRGEYATEAEEYLRESGVQSVE